MRKYLTILVLVVVSFLFGACSNGDSEQTSSQPQTQKSGKIVYRFLNENSLEATIGNEEKEIKFIYQKIK